MSQTIGYQETDIILQTSPEEFSIDPTDDYSAPVHRHHHSTCSSCGCSGHSRKRPSLPTQTTHHTNPAKKLFLDAPPPDHHHHHHQNSAADSASFPLRRTVSDCLAATSPEQANLPATPGPASDSSYHLRPPIPPTLHRSVSAPIPIPSPPPQPEPKSLSRTSSSAAAEDSGKNTPSLKSKILTRLRELDKYMEEELETVERQRQDVVPSTTDNNEHNDNRLVNKDDSAAEFEEWLSVEKVGERMNIHFKCHCGNGYQFLVVDGNCFYKLM